MGKAMVEAFKTDLTKIKPNKNIDICRNSFVYSENIGTKQNQKTSKRLFKLQQIKIIVQYSLFINASCRSKCICIV